MIHVLTHNILPVFAMLALGYALGRSKTASPDEARTLNRIAFLIFQPALIFPLIAGLDLDGFDVRALSVYVACQIVAFLIAYATARVLFAREHLESWLLAMAVVFVNTLLYIWPISFLIYGEAAALPITAIVAWDSAFSFAFFIISMELMAGRGGGARNAVKRIVTNPILLAILAGIAVILTGVTVPQPLLTAADFAGAAAAPLTLIALGIMLSTQALTPQPAVIAISLLKLAAFPALVFGAMALFLPGNAWTDLFTLAAAGPSGAMAFALALLYNVRTDCIAPVIIWTSVLSLLSLALLA